MKKYAEIVGKKINKIIECEEESSWAFNIIDITGVDLSGFSEPSYNYSTSSWEEYSEPVKSLNELKLIKMNKLNEHFTMLFNKNQPSVIAEKESWTTQQNEWSLYVQDANANTPYVDALAVARNISRADLMDKIGIKVLGFATLQGQLQGFEDQIEAVTTSDELDNITW